MTGPLDANAADLAGQAMPVGDPGDEADPLEAAADAEANVADLIEQHQDVPLADDDYDR